MKNVFTFILTLLISGFTFADPQITNAVVYISDAESNEAEAVVLVADQSIESNPLVHASTSYAQLALVVPPSPIPEAIRAKMPASSEMSFKINIKEILKALKEGELIDLTLSFKNGEVVETKARVESYKG